MINKKHIAYVTTKLIKIIVINLAFS